MNEKKNIDRLFQERFKDFESVPNDKIWNNIHHALHEKKKKRVIPLWWKLSGIAAGFILAFFTFNTIWNSNKDAPAVVVAPTRSDAVDQNKFTPIPETDTTIALENGDSLSKLKSNSETSQEKINSNSKKNNGLVNTVQINKSIANNAIAESASRKKQSTFTKKTSIVQSVNAVSTASVEEIGNRNQLTSRANKATTQPLSITSKSLPNNNSNDTFKDKDSTSLAVTTEPNSLEEFLEKKKAKEDLLAVAKINRWQVTTNVAPVYLNSASNGSPIESQFAENSKTYENNLSVGVGIQYAVNKKLAVRTGVNKVTLGYATNDIVFFGGLNASGFSTLSADNATANISVISANNTEGLRPYDENLANLERGILNQTMGYYEVPLELSYAVLDKKFGIQVIGGFSTLLLSENSVSVQSAKTTMSLGKATNLSDIHFSTNIGLGFKYEFLKNFEAHFEPTLIYQFNTFSRDSGNFKPYFVGLYSGINFKF